ncbi:hypothetical protein [Pacificibacter marinus]|uniref:hypothetical protein n=1 Tax=Pacificibacter marinus TaxID=658057 RepID=UPI001C07C260|nr:hypothetical protein [Pacificibacter marinus]MBU2866615.1 hypothetical protein [Pacificibacter marinus]
MKFKILAALAAVVTLQPAVSSAVEVPPCEAPAVLILGYGQMFCQKPMDFKIEGVNRKVIIVEEGFARPLKISKELQMDILKSAKEKR